MFETVLPSKLITHQNSFQDSLVGINFTNEKRLNIKLCVLGQFYEQDKLAEILWIPSAQNFADIKKIQKPSNNLWKVIKENILYLRLGPCVEAPFF